ncbi:MAG: glycosyltransferase family 4 protein [Bryobacteraceae bacterium]
MNILSVAYPLLPVGPDSGGGAEQILYLIERGLVQAGHRSIVIAAKGSQVSGEILETPVFTREITDQVRHEAQRTHRRMLERALDEYSIDLIHFHGLDFHAYRPTRRAPQLATLHLPPAWYPSWIFDLSDIQLNCVSRDQASAAHSPARLPVVTNGIDTNQFRRLRKKLDYLLWIGRVCPEKGVHIALQVAHRLKIRIVIAGPVHPFRDHEAYFSNQVQPLLDSKRKYVGAIGLEEKKKLLAEARCVLLPSLAAETSSLVAMEAISSGTPVLAFRSGALPEVIEHGQTGFIVDSEDEMAEAVERRLHEISPETCRCRAKLRFDARRMVSDYIDLYGDVIAKHANSRE